MTTNTVERAVDRYRDRFPGWTRLGDVDVCPYTVAGVYRDHLSSTPKLCLCQRYAGTGPLDHGKLWETPDGELVLTGEPYGLDGEVLARFVAECRDLGLRVDVDGRSPWNPGSSLLLIIRKETDRA